MVDQHVLTADGFEHGIGVVADTHLAGSERRIFQIGAGSFFIQMEKALKIYRAFGAEDQRFIEFEGGDQAFDNFPRRASINFEAYSLPFAALGDLQVDGFK